MRKFWASQWSHLRLESQGICRVSNAYVQQIPYKLCATFSDKYMAGQTSWFV